MVPSGARCTQSYWTVCLPAISENHVSVPAGCHNLGSYPKCRADCTIHSHTQAALSQPWHYVDFAGRSRFRSSAGHCIRHFVQLVSFPPFPTGAPTNSTKGALGDPGADGVGGAPGGGDVPRIDLKDIVDTEGFVGNGSPSGAEGFGKPVLALFGAGSVTRGVL